MSETQMPAIEASETHEPELMSYEFAFHVLPTVAEGEVPGVFESLKAQIIKAGGEITAEEVPQRFDLAYEVVKYLEGKNRKFSSAYFGWVRFHLSAGALAGLTEAIDGKKELLRYMLIKLTKVEEQNAFRFHDALEHKKVYTITDEEVVEGEGEVEAEVADLVEAEAVVIAPETASETDSAEIK